MYICYEHSMYVSHIHVWVCYIILTTFESFWLRRALDLNQIYQKTHWWGLTSQQKSSWCFLQPQPTGQIYICVTDIYIYVTDELVPFGSCSKLNWQPLSLSLSLSHSLSSYIYNLLEKKNNWVANKAFIGYWLGFKYADCIPCRGARPLIR